LASIVYIMTEKIIFLTFKCQVCERFIPRTEPFYDTVLEIKSGANQIITDENNPEETQNQLDLLIRQIEKSDPKKLEAEVYMKRTFRLCPTCRSRLLSFLRL
jgi:hypothetical protein